MKYVIALFIFMVASLGASAAQSSTHSVVLTWQDASNPAGVTYTVYRATGMCSGTPIFNKVATAITVKTYADMTVTPGNYCYTVSANVNGMESVQSNVVNPSVPAFAPVGLTVTVQ